MLQTPTHHAPAALKRRAVVIDDHPIVADALASVISAMRVFERIETANSLSEGCGLLERDPACQLILLDLHLADAQGRDTLGTLRHRFPDVPVLIFSGDDSLENITMAFELGARGYATKSSPTHVVRSAIELVLNGGSYVPPDAMRILGLAAPARSAVAPAPTQLSLTGRQRQVFELLLQGMPNKVIADRLQMAEGTAKAHLNTVFRVLGVRTRVEAILRARQLGMI